MKRVSIVGNSGSGKTHLAQRLAALMAAPHVELDALYHRPDWQPAPPDEFMRVVAGVANQPTWVIDGNYRAVTMNGPVWQRADTVVWLDLPRSSVMRQVTLRTCARALGRRALWNGNRERLRDVLSWDPDRSIVRWAWTQHAAYRERYTACMASPAFAHLRFVRLCSGREADSWLQSLAETCASETPPRVHA